MDHEESFMEKGGASMVSDIPVETTEVLEFTESTGLSPLTNTFDYNLTLDESKMGIESNWAEANSSAADFPPNSYLSVCPDDDISQSSVLGSVEGPMLGPFAQASVPMNNFFGDSNGAPDTSAVEDASPMGVCGLRNLGNTCFMAAGLQCLTATPPVLKHFLEYQPQEEKSIAPRSLMAHFSTLVGKMWSGKYRVLQPTEFKQTLGFYHSQFKDYRQHDCQEFLALLLDSLHEQMNIAKSNKTCQVPSATATTASCLKENRLNTNFTAASQDTDMGPFDLNQEMDESPNSPNLTMAGSPRDDLMDDLDSDEQCSPTNEEIVDPMESPSSQPKFYNEMKELLDGKFNDIVKDAKTSNANFLVPKQECNNEIHYDSQKFPKENSRRLTLENSNLTENHDFDNKNISIKRIKEVNIAQKNNKTNNLDHSSTANGSDSSLEKCNVKRMRLEDQEKNLRRDGGMGGCSSGLQNNNLENGGQDSAHDEVEAKKHWEKHLKSNKSIIIDTFQGQFKSKVVCAKCSHVSVTYEPFMYLSVPLPNAMEQPMAVTFVPADGQAPIRCVVSLNKQSKVDMLKTKLLETLELKDTSVENIMVALVLENHIAKTLDDHSLIKNIDLTNRALFAFETIKPLERIAEVESRNGRKEDLEDGEIKEEAGENQVPSTSKSNGDSSNASSEESGLCTICLEDWDRDLMKHTEENCKLVMCNQCIENTPRKCPMCKKMATEKSYIKIDQSERPASLVRILSVPLILRHDTDEATNNRKSTKLFGYPHLFKLPSKINARDLQEVVKRVVPQEGSYTLHFVNAQGTRCSRCMYDQHCTGCKVEDTGLITITYSDTLAVRYTEKMPVVQQCINHSTFKEESPCQRLSLYDCLQAFSQSETLDESNPWFCPKCERNQCATKTLTVYRYPKYLIVYLKRFIFYDGMSLKLDDKVTFPLSGLHCGEYLYDLYACVCHFGGVSAGHYTAYAKNPQTDSWHYYNDDVISRQKPQEQDFSNAYILFYSRQGPRTRGSNDKNWLRKDSTDNNNK